MAVSCSNCSNPLNESAKFCSACGAPVGAQQPAQAPPPNWGANWGGNYAQHSRLIRPRYGRMVAGVCQGLANAYGWDVVWVRVLTVLLAIFGGGVGLIGYIVFWVVMPEEPLALPHPNPWPTQPS